MPTLEMCTCSPDTGEYMPTFLCYFQFLLFVKHRDALKTDIVPITSNTPAPIAT